MRSRYLPTATPAEKIVITAAAAPISRLVCDVERFRDDKKETMSKKGMGAVYVLIEDGNKTAEFSIPGLKIIRNNGFDVNEMNELKEYIDGNQDEIFKLAKGINPFRAMMK